METDNADKNFLGYFQQQVLSSYLDEPDKYDVKRDYLSGEVQTTSTYFKIQSAKKVKKSDYYIRVRFGYRTLIDGELAVVAFLPDLFRDSRAHIDRWFGFSISTPIWQKKLDKRFVNWKKLTLEGVWDFKEKIITLKLRETCRLINGITMEAFGENFYKYGNLENINFPQAQNSHRYEDAHAELNRYFIDGINTNIIKLFSKKFSADFDFAMAKDKSIAILFKIFPELESSSHFIEAHKLLRKKRATSVHGIRNPAKSFKASEQFSKDLVILYKGLKFFLNVLEKNLKMNSKNAASRAEAKKSLPTIVKLPQPNYSINKVKFMEGKKVFKVDFGHRESIEGLHESEAIIITFTDGSILGIDTGSNVWNVVSDLKRPKKLNEKDFHVDFMLQWVPAIKK